jgi:hydrogenase maturation factor
MKTKAAAAAANIAANIQRNGLSIPEFCASENISESTYRNMRKAGVGPKELRVGRRVIITVEAAAEWRAMFAKPSTQEIFRQFVRRQCAERALLKQQQNPPQPEAGSPA